MSIIEKFYDKPLKHLPEGKTIFDIPIKERLQYLDPNQDPRHPDLKLTKEEINKQFELNDPYKKALELRESQYKMIKEQQATISQLIQHMTDLTHQVNTLTTKSALLDNNIK